MAAKGSTGVGAGVGPATSPAASRAAGAGCTWASTGRTAKAAPAKTRCGAGDERRRDSEARVAISEAQPVAARARLRGAGGPARRHHAAQRAASALAQPRQSSAARFRPSTTHPMATQSAPPSSRSRGRTGPPRRRRRR